MIKINLKNNKGPAQYRRHKSSGAGFVILFAVTLAAILLSIALGVANIALKEIKFGTSAKDTNDAFFAADTGIECALENDKSGGTSFTPSGVTIQCLGSTIPLSGTYPAQGFVLSGLGSQNKSCAKVSVTKTSTLPIVTTDIVAKGYNDGGGTCTPSANTVERELDTSYITGGSTEGLYDNVTGIRVQVNASKANYSRIVEIEAWGGTPHTNYARGGIVTASSENLPNYPASSVTDGDRRGFGWAAGTGGWNDNTPGNWPDTITITFDGPKSLDEIDVYTLADAFPLSSDPSLSDIFHTWGITDFNVQYTKNNTDWLDVLGSSVNNNDKIWRQFMLP